MQEKIKDDTISRQTAIDALKHNQDVYSHNFHDDPIDKYTTAIIAADIDTLVKLPSAQPEQRWIPCSERLPEEDKDVLISYRYKDGDGDTNHTYIDITTYGDMYFGGNEIGDYKHWREPFQYFRSNYEVIAWQYLPEPYREEK